MSARSETVEGNLTQSQENSPSVNVGDCLHRELPESSVHEINYRQISNFMEHSKNSRNGSQMRPQRYRELSMDVCLPSLKINNNNALSYINTRRTNCSYITNHKIYLNQRGLELSDLYSLKRTMRNANKTTQGQHLGTRVTNYSKTKLPLFSTFGGGMRQFRKVTIQGIQDVNDVCCSNHSRHSLNTGPLYARLMRGLTMEARIPGHVRTKRSTNNRLDIEKSI